MTKTQKIIFTGLVLVLIALLVGVGAIIWPDFSNIVFPPTEVAVVMPVSNTEISHPVASSTVLGTPTLRIKNPTWTPIPSTTLWSILTMVASTTPTPGRAAFTSAPVYSAPVYVKPDCSAYYNYIEDVHQYELDYINYIYDLQVSYYQPLLQQALRERDARMIIQIQQSVNQINAQRDADINTENARYEAERANLDAQCQ